MAKQNTRILKREFKQPINSAHCCERHVSAVGPSYSATWESIGTMVLPNLSLISLTIEKPVARWKLNLTFATA